MSTIWETFNEKGNLIKEYKFWKLLLKENPSKLGQMVAILKREAFPFSQTSDNELSEYAVVAKETEAVLEKLFEPHLVHHLVLMYFDKHIHFHIIPRYHEAKEYERIMWKDDNNPNPLIQKSNNIERRILNKLINDIRINI